MGEDVIITCNNLKEKRIFVNESNELLVTSPEEENYVLCDNVSRDFDAVAENNGMISVMAVATNGTLLYFRYVLGKWEKQIVLDCKSDSKKINNIKLIKLNGRIHAFYCIEYDEKMLLVHHISQNENFYTKPAVIDYINMRCIYHISVDYSFNIHIVYVDEDLQIKYKTFINSAKDYSDNKVNCDDKVRIINTVFFQNYLYCVYLSKERDYNVINCLNLSIDEKRTLGFAVGVLSEPCIFSNENTLYIQWRENGYAFECSAGIDFKFTKPFSLGCSENTLKLRSCANETVAFVDKCAANVYRRPFPSAKNIFDVLIKKKRQFFKTKGSEIEEFQKKSMENHNLCYDDARLEAVEEQLKNLTDIIENLNNSVSNVYKRLFVHDIGEIDEENFKRFNNMNIEEVRGTKAEDKEYIEIREE